MAKLFKIIISLTFILALTSQILLINTVAEQMPYEGYTYDFWGRSVPSQAGYIPDKIYYGEDIGVSEIKDGEDLFVYNGLLYLLDGGNNVVITLDKNYKAVKIIKQFYKADGSTYSLKNPTGLFIKDDLIYIADKGNGRVIKCDLNGKIQSVYERPVTPLLDNKTEFKPSKVLVDEADNCYVMCEGIYQGFVNYDKNGQFVGFFGGNLVKISSNMATAFFWKKILTREQARNMIRFVPIEYSNATIVGDLIYTVTKSNTNSLDEIQKLNPIGKNVLHFSKGVAAYPKNNFGDVETAYYKQTMYDSQLIDINVDEDDIITVLDFERGRLFQYDQECNIVSVFGSKGNQRGSFLTPTAIEKFNGAYIVLDKEKQSLTTFTENAYMKYVREGINYYHKGLYNESIAPWKKVLSLNSNYQLAYLSIGRALYQQNKYAEALTYFKLSQSRKDYSQAFRAYRTELAKKYFLYILIGAIVLIIAFVKFIKFSKRKLNINEKKTKLIFN
jgi:hypothetical protein